MFELLSKRIKNAKGEPEVYIYDSFPSTFRNQVFYIIEEVVDQNNEIYWTSLHRTFAKEKGIKFLGRHTYLDSSNCKLNIESYVSNSNEVDFLDFLDYIFHYFYEEAKDYSDFYFSEKVEEAIRDLNFRMKQHNLGYEFVNGEIIRIDSKILHAEVIKPALFLLFEEGFESAEEEMRKAFEAKRKGNYTSAITECGKAFESTMKIICDKKGYIYKQTDTANKLISILVDNSFFPDYMQTHLNHIKSTLESGLPTIRNREGAHGQGTDASIVSEEYAEYAINLVATNIVFLVKLYQNQK